MISRRAALASGVAVATSAACRAPVPPPSPVKIGNTMPYSGPASTYGVIGRTESAFFKMVNEQGGVDGHTIDFISLRRRLQPAEDGGAGAPAGRRGPGRFLLPEPRHAVQFGHRRVPEPQEDTAVVRRFRRQQVDRHQEVSLDDGLPARLPHRGADLRQAHAGQREGSEARRSSIRTTTSVRTIRPACATSWATTGTRSSSSRSAMKPPIRRSTRRSSSCRAPAPTCCWLRPSPSSPRSRSARCTTCNWKPTFYMTNVAISVGGVITPAGPEKAIGMLSTQYLKDPTDPVFKDDAGMKQWRDFMAKYMPGGDVSDASYVFAYGVSQTMQQVLKQCNGDFSRANVMKQAESLHDFELPVLLPGIKVNTSHTDHRPITSMQFMQVGRQDLGALRRPDRQARPCNAAAGRAAVRVALTGDTDARPRSTARDRPARPASRGRGSAARSGVRATAHRSARAITGASSPSAPPIRKQTVDPRPASVPAGAPVPRCPVACRRIERHDERRVGQRSQQRLAFAPLDLGRRAARLGDLCHGELRSQPCVVAREQLGLRAVAQPADGDQTQHVRPTPCGRPRQCRRCARGA